MGDLAGMREGSAVVDPIDRTTRAARAFLDSLAPDQRAHAWSAFDAPDRREFTYVPGERPGLALRDMTSPQRSAAMDLLATGLSGRGLAEATAIMQLEEILAAIERAIGKARWERRHPEHYWFRVLGEPGSDAWAWKVGGHHLAVHLAVVAGDMAATPQFFGANPALVPPGYPHAGTRFLADEQDLARALVTTLPPQEREAAVTAPVAPRDILTRDDPVADAGKISPGLAYGDMPDEPRELLEQLVRHYLGRVLPQASSPAWDRIRRAGVERVTFRWAGPTDPGHGHYYAVLGPTFLLEYDNTQNDANHIHTVWRDLDNDWGDDLLAAHHARHHASGQGAHR